MSTTYFVAWWNVENLFDEEDSPRRTDKLRRALGSSLNGWTAERRDRKVARLAAAIAQMNDGAGPDLLGVCEVENAFVLDLLADEVNGLLPGRNYAVAHADTQDDRGIDVAFLLDSQLFTAPDDERFQHVVMRRTATREIFQITLHTAAGSKWTVFGNHWPSRSGGHLESAGYRAIAGETLAYFHERTMEVNGKGAPVLAMGDFNDEPFDDSLVRYALSSRERQPVLRGTSPRLWNLMWGIAGREEGTFFFDGGLNLLDQFLANKNMMEAGSQLQVQPGTVTIERGLPGLADTSGPTPKPIPFGGMGKPVNLDGFSDHFPISVQVIEAD